MAGKLYGKPRGSRVIPCSLPTSCPGKPRHNCNCSPRGMEGLSGEQSEDQRPREKACLASCSASQPGPGRKAKTVGTIMKSWIPEVSPNRTMNQVHSRASRAEQSDPLITRARSVTFLPCSSFLWKHLPLRL